MTYEVRDRIGCGPRGWVEIQQHPWFEGIDWNRVEYKDYTPPFQPDNEKANCLSIYELQDQLFPEEEPASLTPDQQAYFEGLDWNIDLKKKDNPDPPDDGRVAGRPPSPSWKRLSQQGRLSQVSLILCYCSVALSRQLFAVFVVGLVV